MTRLILALLAVALLTAVVVSASTVAAQGSQIDPEAVLLVLDDLPPGFVVQDSGPTTSSSDGFTSSQVLFTSDRGGTRAAVLSIAAVLTNPSPLLTQLAMGAFETAITSESEGHQIEGASIGDESQWYTGTLSGAPMTMVVFRIGDTIAMVGLALVDGSVDQDDVLQLAEVAAERIREAVEW